MVYLYGKDEQVRFIQNYFLPDVGPIPDGYEPAFEGEIIQPDWLTWYNVEREWKRTRAPGCNLSFGEYIKPKQKPSAGAVVRNEGGTAVGVADEPPDYIKPGQWLAHQNGRFIWRAIPDCKKKDNRRGCNCAS